MPSGKLLYTENKHPTDMRCFSAAISPVSPVLATGLGDIKLWDISIPNEIKGTYVLPPNIGQQAMLHEDVMWTAYHHTKRAIKHHNETINQHYQFIDFSHDGKWIAAVGDMYDYNRKIKIDMIKVWDLSSKKLFKVIEVNLPDNFQPNYYYSDFRTIKFSPDNRFFAVVSKEKLTILSLPEWNIYREVNEPGIVDIAFSPDGKMFATSSYKRIKIWLEESQIPIDLQKNDIFLAGAKHIIFSPDGSLLAGGDMDGFVRIWDMRKIEENK